ncbi:MAG: DUF6264 family protein [Microbacterium sp.]
MTGSEPASRAGGAPRPQYGEYATPEQQRAAIGQPQASTPAPAQRRPPATGAPQPRATARSARPARTADRIITFALLAYGLVTVLSAIPQLWHFTQFAQTWMTYAGIDAEFTNTAQGELWGRIGAGVFAVGWLITVVLSMRSLARGRLSWWIPVVGAVVTFVVVSGCAVVPLFGDPAVASSLGG